MASMKVGELKQLLAQYDDQDEVMQIDPTGKSAIIPGRLQLKQIHVYQFQNDQSPMNWYSTDYQADNPPYKYVRREFEGILIQFT
jgi:hypothetical protein